VIALHKRDLPKQLGFHFGGSGMGKEPAGNQFYFKLIQKEMPD